jgi:DNA polymerase-3 subunit chi
MEAPQESGFVTQVDFYVQTEDKVGTAVRLAAKAYQLGRRLTVFCTDAETAGRFDRLLWTSPATGFVPHCDSDDKLAAVTPVVIDRSGRDHCHDDVLVNLDAGRPPYFSRFRRLIEIVAADDGDKERARDRYKFYRDRGYEIRTHDLSKNGGGR